MESSPKKTDPHWAPIGKRAHHGFALPLSALRSEKSSGIGEFYDLIPLIDWSKDLGFDVIQLLPLNDTGMDPSPYNALSSCAIDPIYLSLHPLEGAGQKELYDLFQPLNKLPRLAFAQVKQKKIEWLYQYFQKRFSSIAKSSAYLNFLSEHSWLLPYALFKSCKSLYENANLLHWPREAQAYPPTLSSIPPESLNFHTFVQYLCYEQIGHIKAYAEKKGIFLKGDMPILVSPDSADVWANRFLFDRELVAGSVPDAYNRQGQKWGFPLIHWDEMEKTGFAWWKERLHAFSKGFHLYRIDHVMGFFRIWGIPAQKQAKDGHFVPKNRHLWAGLGEHILETLLEISKLLPIAEDLGTVPQEVRPILKKLGICGTKVIRWERDWAHSAAYIPYDLYEPFSMTTVSTHDLDTLSGWWQNSPDEAKAFAAFKNWTYEPKLTPKHLIEILSDAHRTPSYFHINLLQEYLAIFPELVSPNPEDERINNPGIQTDKNWTYRFKPSIEEMRNHPELTGTIQSLICKN